MAAQSKGSKVSRGISSGSSKKAETVKLKLTLDRETVRLLKLEAFGRDCSLSEVVASMVASIPRRFVLTDRGTRGQVGSQGTQLGFPPRADGAQGEALPLGVVSEAG
jgi:hypothetical protein